MPVGRRSDGVRCSTTYVHSDLPLLESRSLRRGSSDGETGAFAWLAVDGDRAAHGDADVLDDPQPDAESATALLDAALEPLEDPGLLIGRDADAMVADAQSRATWSSASTSTSIGRPAPNRMALDSRFRQICSTRIRSHEPVAFARWRT